MKKINYLPFATWLRTASTIMILLCHYCIQSETSVITALAHIFNIGVPLFFILSGFLSGYLGIKSSILSWFIKRFKRIFVSFWMFLFFLSLIHFLRGYEAAASDWMMIFLGLQGSVVGVPGAEQTWFLSVLLLCYLLTPMVLRISNWVYQQKSKGFLLLSAVILSVLPIGYALFEQAWVSTILTPVSIYIFACVWGQHYSANKVYSVKKIAIAVMITVAALVFRFAAKLYIDGTIWYDRVVVHYTHAIAAFAIFYTFNAVFRGSSVPGFIQFISDISFEIYLYHYIFTIGVIPMFGVTSFWLLDCILTTALTLGISWLANRATARIHRLISKSV